jgi:hypothetical protein
MSENQHEELPKLEPGGPTPPPAAYGWICPRCGAGNAPWNPHCPCVPILLGPVTCQSESLYDHTLPD